MPNRPVELTRYESIVCRPIPFGTKLKYIAPIDSLDTRPVSGATGVAARRAVFFAFLESPLLVLEPEFGPEVAL